MKFYKIQMLGRLIAEIVDKSTLVYNASLDKGRVFYDSVSNKLYFGDNTQFSQVGGAADVTYENLNANGDVGTGATQVSQGTHGHSGFAPSPHGNAHHSFNYIIASDVTYENLNANGDVGTGATQVSQGTHTHTGLGSQQDNVSLLLYEPNIENFTWGFTIPGFGALGDKKNHPILYSSATPCTVTFIGMRSEGYVTLYLAYLRIPANANNFVIALYSGVVSRNGYFRCSLGALPYTDILVTTSIILQTTTFDVTSLRGTTQVLKWGGWTTDNSPGIFQLQHNSIVLNTPEPVYEGDPLPSTYAYNISPAYEYAYFT